MFTANQFTPTKWDTAEDKAKFANQFIKFVESNFKRTKFPKWFYTRLSNCFGHIAHYNQDGFYQNFFTNGQDKREFVHQCINYPCYGQPEFTYCDVEKVLIDWLRNIYAV